MENEENTAVEVSEETKSEETKTEKPKLFKKPKVKLYSKHRDEDDAETEAFARGELEKFNREKQKQQPFKRTLKHQKKLQTQMVKLLLQLNALKMQKNVFLRNVMTI